MTVVFLINDKFHIVYLDNVIFHRLGPTTSLIRSELWVRRRSRYLIFSQFSMLLPKCVCLRGSAPDPAGGLPAPPAGKRSVSQLQRAPQNCGPQGPETPRAATDSNTVARHSKLVSDSIKTISGDENTETKTENYPNMNKLCLCDNCGWARGILI